MAKKKTYTFYEDRQAKSGITSMVLGVPALVLLLLLLWVSWFLKGSGGPALGAFGFASAVLSFCGLVCGLASFREQHARHTFSKAGSILNGVVLLIWVFIILVGLS